jgi:acyl-CoA synthetase (AMP-forming)/AMP-acid ligase II
LSVPCLNSKGVEERRSSRVLLHNCYEFVEIYFASAKRGIFCPYNNLLKEKELKDIINYSTPRFLILNADYGPVIDSLKPQLDSVEHYICLQNPQWPYMEAYESVLSRGGKNEPGIKIGDDEVMNIIFTAGTTGMSKGAMRTHRHIITNATAAIIEMKISYEERVLITYPMYHVAFDDHVCRHFLMPNTTVIRREEF